MDFPTLAQARTQAADLIERVLSSSISPEEALDQWPLPIKSPSRTITVAWTHLSHFADDKELQEKDPAYSEARKKELAQLAKKLRNEVIQFGDLRSPNLPAQILGSIVRRIKLYVNTVTKK